MLIMVVMKLIAPKIDDVPPKCKLKIAKSTEGPECACTLANGGIQSSKAQLQSSTKAELNNNNNAGGNSQNILFKY